MATTRNKVMWQEGMLMRPHHFQQQQRYNDYLDNQRFRAMNDLSWGFTELTLNNELLAQGKIMIDSASGTLPDGTVFSIPDQDALPDPLHPQNFPDERSRNIYLALPVASDVRNEISDGRRIGRYRLNYADVRDLHSEEGDARTLTLGQLTPRIMSGAEDMSAYITLPLCRISNRHADGSLTLDDDFIPSCQNIQVSKKLRVYLKEVQGAIGGRASDLANRIGSPAQSGIADVAEFMMLQLLNRNQTRFTHRARRSQLHPEDFYLDLAGLLGELMTFTEPSRLPCPLDVYDHHDLTKTFKTLLTGINRDRLQQDFVQWTQESAESVVPDADGKGAGTMTDASDTLLARYAKNMTADARNGRLDPVLCRDHEIDLMIDILCRRRKNNPVVVGEAGVGKSALIEGLALRIVAGQVPDKLKNTDIMTLDLGALQAGASVKGEFEKRFKGLMAEVISSPVPVILFIDEAHTLIGAGNQQGGLDISNLLKPALARGELKTIAATTWSEYKKYFEKDAALSRRFQLVKVSEPNAAEATIILRGLSAVYEQSHGVLIDDDALQAAATLSERYLSGRQLPDKAIDVLDTACARVAINLSSPPKQISALTTLSHQQEAEIRQLERELRIGLRTDTSRMTEVLVQYDETLTALDELEAAWHQQQTLVREIIALRQQLLGVAEDDAAPLPDADTVEDTQPESESEQDNTGAVPADEADREQPEETAETVSPVQRLAQLTAELDALHNDRLLVTEQTGSRCDSGRHVHPPRP
ncbi:ATP-dependent Clp proteinase Aec27 ATP-binding chain, with chaperone activity [Escherichia coli]|nr:type VI secretion ATPase, ClpV1 family [Escherichia coli]OAC45294.1 type VI secretion ATPase, ClpV1 family [Escherichia coli]SQM30768.1 ATP-dependent Clp proteinase Aec27 ATP-binding chain, with chaperone activity [Escherichia coli]SQM72278.1 ATP-dependent Clp proteinase Aec27 ATP-binding chain, with chaperone activity [Escherichia coli]